MHKRIQELAKQATKIIEPNDPDFRHEVFDKEKFAELIVKECSTMVFNSHPDDLPFVGGKMLVHFGFGVEE